jgi:hypothetical protein
MHVFANVIKYLLAGQLKINVNGEQIKINSNILRIYEADDFPDMKFFTRGSSVQKPIHRNTLFDNQLRPKINVDKGKLMQDHNIVESEIREFIKFVTIFEDMYELFFFDNVQFTDIHKDKMIKYKNYVQTLIFSNLQFAQLEYTKTTSYALKNFLFTVPIHLHDMNINFNLQNLNQWELESIYDNIKKINNQKPTKKQFICTLNQILNFDFIDNSHQKFSKEHMIESPTITPVLSMNDLIIEDVVKKHGEMEKKLRAEYVFYHVCIKLAPPIINEPNFWTDAEIPTNSDYYKKYSVSLGLVIIIT